jgi:hypothetical protein
MADYSSGPSGPRASARTTSADLDLEAALSLARAAARTLRELSGDADAAFKRNLQREIDRVKLAGPGTPDLVLMRLREFCKD